MKHTETHNDGYVTYQIEIEPRASGFAMKHLVKALMKTHNHPCLSTVKIKGDSVTFKLLDGNGDLGGLVLQFSRYDTNHASQLELVEMKESGERMFSEWLESLFDFMLCLRCLQISDPNAYEFAHKQEVKGLTDRIAALERVVNEVGQRVDVVQADLHYKKG